MKIYREVGFSVWEDSL